MRLAGFRLLSATLMLAAGPAGATCPSHRECRDSWLWDGVLPGMILAGVAVWVGGPFVVAGLRFMTKGRQRGGAPAAGRGGDFGD